MADLDGTILNYDGSISKELNDLSEKLDKIGIHFTIATGRSKVPALNFAKSLNIKIPIICSGGALLTDVESSKDIYHHEINNELFRSLQADIGNSGKIALYSKEKIYVSKKFRWIEDYCVRQNIKLIKINKLQDAPYKTVLLIVTKNNEIDAIQRKLTDKYSLFLEINKTFDNLCEVSSIRGSKLNSAKDICSLFNLSKNDLFYFGDGAADINLIKYAKYGFTVKGSLAFREMPEKDSIDTPDKLGFVNYINSIIK